MPFISLSKEKGGTSVSPSCLVMTVKSTLLELTLTGVPVLNLKIGMPADAKEAESPMDLGSPSGPVRHTTSPLMVLDSIYVPEQITTADAEYTARLSVRTPVTLSLSSPSVRRSVI